MHLRLPIRATYNGPMTYLHFLLLTFFSIVVPIGSLFFIGLPLAIIFHFQKNMQWIIAPFLGLASIVLILQNLIYLGVPIEKSYLSIWMGGIFLWGYLYATEKIKTIHPLPKRLFFAAFVAYFLHALGMLFVSPEYYVGHGWYDQLSYVATSQFLIDHSLPKTTLSALLYEPTAIKAYLFTTTNRIGESIFAAFIAKSMWVNAKTSFEPVILLLPFLTVLVIYEVATRFLFSNKTALIIAILAGCLPAVALMHLESFLSQALVSPLLLLWPCVLSDIFDQPNWRKIMLGALLLAVVASIYVEYYVLFLLISAGYVSVIVFRSKKITPFFLLAIMLIIAFCFNLGFAKYFFEIAIRSARERPWATIYPWANSLSALTWLWLGEFTLMLKGISKWSCDVVSVSFFVLGYLGFGYVAYVKRNAFSITMFFLLLLPIMVWLRNVNHFGYQFYKLLISVSPLFLVGIALACQWLTKKIIRVRPHYLEIRNYFVTLIGFLLVSSTLFMILVSAQPKTLADLKRGVGYKLLWPDTKEVQDILSNMKGKNILIAWQDDFRRGDFLNGWLSYFARNNRVWLVNPEVGEENFHQYLASIKTLPSRYLLLTMQARPYVVKNREVRKVWGNGTFVLMEVMPLKFI
jgi:hypothetical protein